MANDWPKFVLIVLNWPKLFCCSGCIRMSVWNSLRQLDAYPKLSEEFKVRTASGACISIAAILFMVTLFLSELSLYMTVQKVDHLVVDTASAAKLPINLHFVFDRVPCSRKNFVRPIQRSDTIA